MIKKLIRKLFGMKDDPASAEKPSGPRILGPTEHKIDPKLVSNNALKVTQTLQDAGFQAFVVGGAVRDLLLGVSPKDFDIATDATPEQVRKLFRRAFIIGRRFQIVHVMFGQDLLEVTTFRGSSTEQAPKDEHGRVLRDNTFGSQQEDAIRRDFTINAMYYNPATQEVLDYHGGMTDIEAKVLRIIGHPETRYREDPVRMLRLVRFAAKLQFTIDPGSSAPIAVMAPLINNVPAARVFDEMLKLLTSGHALACLQQLRKEGLHHGLLPLLDVVLEQPLGAKFVTLALVNTDERIHQGKGVSPGFLFAALLWHQVLEKWRAYQAAGEHTIPALHLAADDVLASQTEKLALQRKIGADMREIWAMQPRFERRNGKNPYRLLEHVRFRAAYDFLLLRCASGEVDEELGNWWTNFIAADPNQRQEQVNAAAKAPRGPRPGPGAASGHGSQRGNNTADNTAAGRSDAAPDDDDDLMPESDNGGSDSAGPRKRARRGRRRRSGGGHSGSGGGNA